MTVPLLPTDGCPSCLTMPVHPEEIWAPDDSDSIAARYECPACGHGWWTGWAREALTLPCPGCAECSLVSESPRSA